MTLATFAFVVAALFAAWYLRYHVGMRLSVTFLLFSSLLLIHGLPALIYLHVTGPDTIIYEAALGPVDRETVQARLLAALALMFIFIVVGSALARVVFVKWARSGRRALRASQAIGLRHTLRLTLANRSALWIVVVAMAAVSVYETQFTKVIDYFASGTSELDKILLRTETGGTPFYLYNVVLYSVAPFLVMVAYCAERNRRQLRGLSALVIALFAVVMLGKFGTLSKAPPVIFLLQLVLFRALLKRQPVNLGLLIMILGAALLLFLVIVRMTIPDLDLGSALAFLYYRIFDIPNESLLEYFAAIPASLPHGWGTGLFGFLRDSTNVDQLPTYFAVAEVTRGSVLSSSNALFVGDAWAEFAWPGVVVFSMLAGFIVNAIDLYAFRRGASDESACLVAGCAFGVFTMLSTSLTTAMLTGGLVLLPILSVAFVGRHRVRARRPGDAAPNRLLQSESA